VRKLALVLLVCLAAATVVLAQNKGREPALRTVLGTVVDKQGAPIDSAVVYLKNQQTQDVTTHISDKDGSYRFSGLDMNVDYQIHAEHEGATSSAHSISNFDTRKEVVVTLKLDRPKSDK
jgi:hypothetical protein